MEPKHTPVQRSSGAGPIPLPRDAMRSLSGFPNPALRAMRPLALILAGVAVPIWGVAGLTLGLTLLVQGVLVLTLAVLLSLVLAPIGFACRTWPDWRSGWLCRPEWFLDPWSWLCRCWLRWPWLCWSWLR